MSAASTYPHQNELRKYIQISRSIRELSTPELDEIGSDDRFRAIMVDNFSRIGELSRANSEILNKYYFPMLQGDYRLSHDEKELIDQFMSELTDPYTLDNLDVFLKYQLMEHLMAKLPEDDDQRIEILDEFVSVAYSMVYNTLSVYPGSDIFMHYREVGLRAAKELLGYLDHDRFAALKTDKAKAAVLINSRYICVLLQRPDAYGNKQQNAEEIDILKKSLALADDPFYKEHAPSYDWRYHCFRACEFSAGLTEFNNALGFDAAQLEYLYELSERALSMYESDPEYFSQISNLNNLKFYHAQNSYLTNRSTKQAHKDLLMDLFKSSKTTATGQADMSAIMAATEYVLLIDQFDISESDAADLRYLYRSLIPIVYRQTYRGTLFAIMYYVSVLLRNYVEVPEGESFEEFCLNIMAAIHPMTYAHTLNVSTLAHTLAGHLLELEPELFVGIPGFESLEAVLNNKEALLDFVKHAALCHDFGKLFIIEVIRTYGRTLLDSEEELIRSHVDAGAHLLSIHEDTAPFAEIALGHHKWFNNQGGYPETFDAQNTPYRTVIDIVMCADCIDAATDSVGRSYKEGKVLEDVLQEIQEGIGTRYVPFLERLLSDKNVRHDIENQLSLGRDDNYRNAYHVLKTQA